MSSQAERRQQLLGEISFPFRQRLHALRKAGRAAEADALLAALRDPELSKALRAVLDNWMVQQGPWLTVSRAKHIGGSSPEGRATGGVRSASEASGEARPSEKPPRAKKIFGGLQGGAWLDDLEWRQLAKRTADKLGLPFPVFTNPFWKRAHALASKRVGEGSSLAHLEAAVTTAVALRQREAFSGYSNLMYIWGSGFLVLMAEINARPVGKGQSFREQTSEVKPLTPEELVARAEA